MTSRSINEALSDLIAEAKAIAGDARVTFRSLTAQQLNWKPNQQQWTMPDLWRTIFAVFLTVLQLLSFVSTGAVPLNTSDYFKITVVDEQTGRGVPLVELKTTNDVRYYTDSNGIVAFFEPDLMDREVFF